MKIAHLGHLPTSVRLVSCISLLAGGETGCQRYPYGLSSCLMILPAVRATSVDMQLFVVSGWPLANTT
jgi:hypothetical protein